MGELVPLLLALGAASAVYALRDRARKRKSVRPAYPDISVQQVWELWKRGIRDASDTSLEVLQAGEFPVRLEGQIVTQMLQTEHLCVKSEYPRIALRRAILENSTVVLHLEALLQVGEAERQVLLSGYQAGMEPWLRDSLADARVRCGVLRQYAHWKFDHTAEDDWLHYFYRTAGPYIREKVRLAQEVCLERDKESLRLVEIYDQLLQELGHRSLKAAPKQQFPRPDLP